MQSHASRQLPVVFRQQKAALRWGVVAGEPRKLWLEILKAEIDAERLGILQEQFARLRDLRGRLPLRERESRDGPRYPMSMPPFTFNTCPVI